MPKQWSFSKGGKKASFKWWDQYIAGSGVQTETGSIKDAEVVFVGYGIQAPEYGWDDFKGKDLHCESAKVSASSSGDADVYAARSVAGNASSSGDVRIHGNPPQVESHTSSSGSVKKAS